MSKDFLEQRRNALEESFFAKRNAELLKRLRKNAALEARKKELMETAGIRDHAILDELIRLDISGETVIALSLIPLIEVAWADGSVDQKEREAVIEAAEGQGLAKAGPAHDLLENWLKEQPEARLMDLWKSYAQALVAGLAEDARARLRGELIGRARAVAEAAGGFLGLGKKVSNAERRVLEEMEQALR